MRVLGINLGHDSNACLVEDGKIVRFIQEERFNRIKVGVNNALESVKYCLGEYKMSDIDKVVISDGISGLGHSHYQTLLKNNATIGLPINIKKQGNHVDNVIDMEHHLCHAGSTYYTSGCTESLIISMDGIGEKTTHYVAIGKGKEIKPVYIISTEGIMSKLGGKYKYRKFKKEKAYSIGWFYGMVTEGLGWRMVCDEGKTMGLAPYGDAHKVPLKEMKESMYETKPEGFYVNNGQVSYHFGGADKYKKLAEKYGNENVAASAQKMLEDYVIRFVKRMVKRTGIKTLCTAGGVFLNVKVNQRIMQECGLDYYYPMPLASDTGISIGAAFVEYYKHSLGEYKPFKLEHLYYGSEYSNEYIKSILDRNKIKYKDYDVNYVAQALADNKIIARFDGKMEGGPRALGNRSILMSPLKGENKAIINSLVKFREGFRPFCPSVTWEDKDRYFDGGGEFMITACNVKGNDIPAVTHVDGTARPQFVRKEVNPKYHEILSAFGGITGHPVLLNTSFNVMGMPIIRTPGEAISCFFGVGLDILIIGDYIVEKERA